jgi:hypothetical protein
MIRIPLLAHDFTAKPVPTFADRALVTLFQPMLLDPEHIGEPGGGGPRF